MPGTPKPKLWNDWISHPPDVPAYPPEPRPDLPAESFLDAIGIFTGTLFDIAVPYEQVQELLHTAGIEPPDGSSPAQPVRVTLAVGYQEKVSARFPSWPTFSYLELVLGIPGLTRFSTGALGMTFAYLGRLCLDQEFPTALGRMIGFPKTMAEFTTTFGGVDIRDADSDAHILNGEFDPTGKTDNALAFPGASAALKTFGQPVVSKNAAQDWWLIHFNWKWHRAAMQEITGEIEIFDGFGKGRYVWVPSGNSQHVFGAWRVRVPWEMFLPKPVD